MKWQRVALAALLSFPVLAAEFDLEAAKKEEQRECVACHGLRFIHTQRLSKAAWQKELDKMAGWGAEMKNRDLLLQYLASEYGDTKPIPEPARSSDGSHLPKR